MAITLSQLQDYVDANIKQNGRNAITGNVMNYALQNTLDLLNGKQDALVSGTTIKTINGTSLLGSGNITISSGITVGSTAIGSGTNSRLLFQSGGVVSQSSKLTFDGTLLKLTATSYTVSENVLSVRSYTDDRNLIKVNGLGKTDWGFDTAGLDMITIEPQQARIEQTAYGGLKIMSLSAIEGYVGHGVGAYKFGIGANSPQARLDIRSQGALSTDLALRVRNSANNDNILLVKGDQSIDFLGAGTGGYLNLSRSGGNVTLKHRATAILPSQFIISSYGDGGSVGQIVFDTVFGTNTAPTFTMQRFISGLSDLTGSSLYTPFGSNAAVFVMKNALNYAGYGIIPTGTATDHFAMYSADIVSGNAAPHFRTENGSVIKLFKQDLPTSPTTSEVATLLSNLGLANLI